MSGNRPLAEKDLTDFYESLVTRQRNYPPRVLERLGKIEEKFKNYLNSLTTKDPIFIRRAQREFLERLNSLKKNEEGFYKAHFDARAVERICHDIETKKAEGTINILDEVDLIDSFRRIYDEKTEQSKEEKKEYKEAVEKLNLRAGTSLEEQKVISSSSVKEDPWFYINLHQQRAGEFAKIGKQKLNEQDYKQARDAYQLTLEELNMEYKLLAAIPPSNQFDSTRRSVVTLDERMLINQNDSATVFFNIGVTLWHEEENPKRFNNALGEFVKAYEKQKTPPPNTSERKQALGKYQFWIATTLYEIGKKHLIEGDIQQAHKRFTEATERLRDSTSDFSTLNTHDLEQKIVSAQKDNLETRSATVDHSAEVSKNFAAADPGDSETATLPESVPSDYSEGGLIDLPPDYPAPPETVTLPESVPSDYSEGGLIDLPPDDLSYSSTAVITQLAHMKTIAAPPKPDLFQVAAPAEAPATGSYPTVGVELSQNMLECAEDICEMTENLLEDEKWDPEWRDQIQQYLEAFHPILMAEKKDGAAIQRGIAELQKVFEEIPESMRPERLGQLHQHFQSMLRPETPPAPPPQARR